MVVKRTPDRFKFLYPETRPVMPDGYTAPLDMRLTRMRQMPNDKPKKQVRDPKDCFRWWQAFGYTHDGKKK
jgi:hypothetical protein